MIKLTHLGGDPFILNADLIRYVEALPDTFITLTTGDRVMVRESMDEVLRRAVLYQQAKHLIPSAACHTPWPLEEAPRSSSPPETADTPARSPQNP